jgi:aryl-alcohol dehydrogenase-like predicted oxidoreductase
MQNLYNLVWREEERQMNRYCRDEGVGLMPWSPLAGGLAVDWRQTGRQLSARAVGGKGPAEMYGSPEDYRVFDALAAVAGQVGAASQASTALAWLLGRPGVVSPIVGVTKLEHLEVALAVFDISLAPAQVAQLDDAYVWPRLLGFHQ